jgi:hypothetical protein
MAFREYLRMRQADLYCDGNFRLLAQWVKFINVLGLEGGFFCGGEGEIFVFQPHDYV